MSVAAVVAALVSAAPSQAALRFQPCRDAPFECARLGVPLDRSGTLPGKVSLFVKRAAARAKPRRGVVVALAGGPGQSAAAAFSNDSLGALSELRATRDLVVFDQRGTGRSGLLRCPELERANILRAGGPASRCAARLGARRARYTSKDTADDLEAIRIALGAPTLSLFGVSYGTRTALSYALRYPTRVDRMALDSVVQADGPDALGADTFAAVPRVLRSLCAGRACDSFTRDPVADVGRLVGRVAAKGPLRGRLVDGRGRPRNATLGRYDLFSTLVAGDFEPTLRRQYPAAVASALRGDATPMLRLNRRAIAVENDDSPPRELSPALYAATTCEEAALPWPRGTPFGARRARAAQAVAALARSRFFPFDQATSLGSDLIDLCSRWPEATADPIPGVGPLPDVPTLLVEGADDLRTPLEAARAVADQLPQARVVTVRGVGHSPIGMDVSRCANGLVPRFFASRAVPTACRDYRRGPPLARVAPRSLSSVAPARGERGRSGRAATAVKLTLRDVTDDLDFATTSRGTSRGVGLRSGRYALDGSKNTLSVRDVSFVAGIGISGRIASFGARNQTGRLRVRGPLGTRGALEIHGGRFIGRLGGERVRGSLQLELLRRSNVHAAARR